MARKPNVVIFFSDQQRWDTVGLHGCPLDLTPNFDYWATRGTFFAHATTPQPVCGPARACLQTGRFATAIGEGCQTNGRPLPNDADTIARRFAAAGYATGYFGKWHLAPDRGLLPRHDNLPAEYVYPEHRAGWQTFLGANSVEACSDGYDAILYDNDGRTVKLPGYRVDAITDAAIRWMGQHLNDDRPFLCMMSFLEPHMQNHRDAHPAPAGYEQRYRGRWTPPDLASLPGHPEFYRHMTGGNAQQALPGYLGSIKRLDEAFGRVMDTLVSFGREQDSMVASTSDHGCHFRTRNNEYKRSCHDVSVRVPCMIHGGPFLRGGRDDRAFQLTDLAPTLCDAAGLEAPTGAQGRSALRGLADEAFMQVSEATVARAVRTTRWKYAATAEGSDYKVRHASRYTESHLYDLVADPYELVNLAGLDQVSAIRREMKQRLAQRMEAAGEPPAELLDAARPQVLPGQTGQRRQKPGDALHPLVT